MVRFNLNPLVLMLVLAALAFAGVTNFNSITLDPTQGETNSLRVNNASGPAQLTITAAGAATFAGTVAMQGAQTVTADMTAGWADEEYLQLVDDCEARESRLTDWERGFVASIRERL